MADDRELLEAAARAAGLDADLDITEMGGIPVGIWRKGSKHPDAVRCFWGPLREDGDALRLAVKLRLEIVPVDGGYIDVCLPGSEPFVCACERNEEDRYAATRRAIVRAAATLGEQEKDR